MNESLDLHGIIQSTRVCIKLRCQRAETRNRLCDTAVQNVEIHAARWSHSSRSEWSQFGINSLRSSRRCQPIVHCDRPHCRQRRCERHRVETNDNNVSHGSAEKPVKICRELRHRGPLLDVEQRAIQRRRPQIVGRMPLAVRMLCDADEMPDAKTTAAAAGYRWKEPAG